MSDKHSPKLRAMAEGGEIQKFAEGGGPAAQPPGFISDADFASMQGSPAQGDQPTAKSLTGQPAQNAQPAANAKPEGFISDADFAGMQSHEQDLEQKYGGIGGALKAGAQGFLSGAIPGAPILEKLAGVPYSTQREIKEARPNISGLGEVAGFGGSLLATAGLGPLVSGAGEAATMAAGLSAPATYAARVGASALKGAVEMSVLAGNDEVNKRIIQDPNTSAEQAISDVGLSAALGAAGGVFTAGVLSPLWRATLGPKLESALKNISSDVTSNMKDAAPDNMMRPIVKRVLSAFGGVSPEVIDSYLENHSAIQKLPEFEEVYGNALDSVGKIHDDIAAGKASLGEAKSSYKELEQQINQDLRNKGFEANVANSLSKQALSDAQDKLAFDLQQRALNSGRQVAESVESLRQKVIDASSDAYNVLEKADPRIPLSGVLDNAEMMSRRIEAEGTVEAKGQAARLREYAKGLSDQFGSEINGVQAKQLLQGLDKISKWNFNASSFDNGLSNYYKQIRFHLDDTLKNAVPEYRAAMKPLSRATDLLSQLSPYGTEEDAIRRLKSIKNADKFKTDMPLLKRLENATGSKFTHDIEPYANPLLREQLEKSLPQYSKAQETAAHLQALKDPKTRQALLEALQQSEEAKAVEAAQGQLSAAEAEKEKIKGITPQTLQGKLKSVMTPGKNIANEEALKNLPGMNGMDLPKLMNLMRVKEAFDKNATRGSKHVNLYGGMMAALAKIAGLSGIGGFGAGAGIGAMVDSAGPGFVQKVLDKYMEHYGNLSELSRSNPGATKAMLGKILSHDGEASGAGFKSGVDYVSSIYNSNKAMAKAAANVFKPGATVLSPNQMPTSKSLIKLDKLVAQHKDNPNQAINNASASKVGHYLPDHQTALTQAQLRAVQYLNSIKPSVMSPNPLDTEIEVTPQQQARYERALSISENPLIVLNHLKDGTLQVSDLQDLQAMFPNYGNVLKQAVTREMMTAKSDKQHIPYKTRVSASLLLGQPLDSSMKPTSIVAAQPKPKAPEQPPQGSKPQGGKKGTSTLGKSNASYRTPGQAAEADRGNRD